MRVATSEATTTQAVYVYIGIWVSDEKKKSLFLAKVMILDIACASAVHGVVGICAYACMRVCL